MKSGFSRCTKWHRGWNVGTNDYSQRRDPYVGIRQKHYFNIIFARRVMKNVGKKEDSPDAYQTKSEIGTQFPTGYMKRRDKLKLVLCVRVRSSMLHA